jgi:hypothetical protein
MKKGLRIEGEWSSQRYAVNGAVMGGSQLRDCVVVEGNAVMWRWREVCSQRLRYGSGECSHVAVEGGLQLRDCDVAAGNAVR